MKRKLICILITVCFAGAAFGCGNSNQTNIADNNTSEASANNIQETDKAENNEAAPEENADSSAGIEVPKTITNKKIPVKDITDFYYTYENINFNAFYQRYRFYIEDGKTMFHHETREKPNAYGWTTEEDITKSGTFELSSEKWNEFLMLLKDGTVSARSDSAEAGDSGPWLYIYWKNDKGKYQVFDFESFEKMSEFEAFCEELAS